MKKLRLLAMMLVTALVSALVSGAPVSAFAQEPAIGESSIGGDIRSPSPGIMNTDRPGYYQVGIGPSFATGLNSDRAMYDLTLGYFYNFSERLAGKIMSDLNFGTSTDVSRLIIVGGGAELYFPEAASSIGAPYITGDVGFGFARNDENRLLDAPTAGVGLGFKSATEYLNLDVNVHYTSMFGTLDGRTPTVLGIRTALNF